MATPCHTPMALTSLDAEAWLKDDLQQKSIFHLNKSHKRFIKNEKHME
jgi:hypothetical protein